MWLHGLYAIDQMFSVPLPVLAVCCALRHQLSMILSNLIASEDAQLQTWFRIAMQTWFYKTQTIRSLCGSMLMCISMHICIA
jgi:hypothetical protein